MQAPLPLHGPIASISSTDYMCDMTVTKRARTAAYTSAAPKAPEEPRLHWLQCAVVPRSSHGACTTLSDVQRHVLGFLPMKAIGKLRQVDAARRHLPVLQPLQVRLCFYIDEIDGIGSLMSSLPAFDCLPSHEQTPAALYSVLTECGLDLDPGVFQDVNGYRLLCAPYNACWFRSEPPATYCRLLVPEMLTAVTPFEAASLCLIRPEMAEVTGGMTRLLHTREDLLLASRQDGCRQVLDLKVAGPVPLWFKTNMHAVLDCAARPNDTDIATATVANTVTDTVTDTFTARHKAIDDMLLCHARMFSDDLQRRSRILYRINARLWTPSFFDPEAAHGTMALVDSIAIGRDGVARLIRQDFRDPDVIVVA